MIHRLSSAIKFIKLLEGKSDLYIHLRPSMEWDTASGQALLEMLGGKIFNISLSNNDFNFGLEMEYKKDGLEMSHSSLISKNLFNYG